MGRGIWILCLAWLGCTTGSVARVQADDGHCNALLDLAARRQVSATRPLAGINWQGGGSPEAMRAAARWAVQLEHAISTVPVLLLGLSHMRCTQLALMTLQRLEVCVEERTWEDPEEPQYRYLRCLYPDELEGTDTACLG